MSRITTCMLGTLLPILVTLTCAGGGSCVQAGAYEVTNSQKNANMKYDVTGTFEGGGGFTDVVELDPGGARTYGGPNGFGSTRDKEVKEYKETHSSTSLFNGISGTFFSPAPEGPVQTAFLLVDAAGVTEVHSFFDFVTPNYTELVANVAFDFAGFESNRIPVLLLAGTDTRITDSNGQLLPEFQFTGTTAALGTLVNIPEPSTLSLLGIGILSLLSYGWRRRKAAANRSG